MTAQPAVRTENRSEGKRKIQVGLVLTEDEQKFVEKTVPFVLEKIGDHTEFIRLVKRIFTETVKNFNLYNCEISCNSELVDYVLSLARCDFSLKGRKKKIILLLVDDTVLSFFQKNPVHVSRLFKLCYLLASLKVLSFCYKSALRGSKSNPAKKKVNHFGDEDKSEQKR